MLLLRVKKIYTAKVTQKIEPYKLFFVKKG